MLDFCSHESPAAADLDAKPTHTHTHTHMATTSFALEETMMQRKVGGNIGNLLGDVRRGRNAH